MSLNVNKCLALRFTRKKKSIARTYNINGYNLQNVTDSWDFEITIDSKLKLDVHIDTISHKSLQMLGLITRSYNSFKNPQANIIIYNALMRSEVKYCSSWIYFTYFSKQCKINFYVIFPTLIFFSKSCLAIWPSSSL